MKQLRPNRLIVKESLANLFGCEFAPLAARRKRRRGGSGKKKVGHPGMNVRRSTAS